MKTYRVNLIASDMTRYFVMFKGFDTVHVYGKAKTFADASGLKLGTILEVKG